MNRILQYDQIDFSPTEITQRDDPLFGPVTVFHDVPIARTIVQQYEDGFAYKPANELETAAWTAQDRWVVIGGHPNTAIVSNRDNIGGRTTNIRFTKSLKNAKTKRPEDRGILADLEVFDDKVPPDVLKAMKSGTKRDVSIGFFFDQDSTPGVIGDDYPQLKGTKYDYIQRNIMIDHTAAALDTGSGRCSFPECGIGADQFKKLVTGDPFAGYPTFEACIKDIMKKNPDYTRKQAAGTCAVIEQKSKEKHKEDVTPRSEAERAMAHFNISEEAWGKLSDEEKQEYISKLPERGSGGEDFKPTDGDNLSMSKQEAIEKFIEALDTFKQLFIVEDKVEGDDLVEEEYQGNAESITESKRARLFFNISEDDWDALSEVEKGDYISRLPPKKTRAGGEEMSNRDCEYQWNDIREKILRTDAIEQLELSQILKEMTFDGEVVTISEETKDKLREHGIDLAPCGDDEVEDEEELDEGDIELESEETKEDLPSTDEVLWETEKVMRDLKRLVG